MDEAIITKLGRARRILRKGGDDCKDELQVLTGLPFADRRRRFNASFKRIFEKMGESLYQAARLFVNPADSLEFYFWPGYDSILEKGQAKRITLTVVDGIANISCGIALPYRDGDSRPAKSPTTDWFYRVLTDRGDKLDGEPFTPGSTHFWITQRGLKLNDGTSQGGPFNVLAVETLPSVEEQVADMEAGVLRIPLDYSKPTTWVDTIDRTLNDSGKIFIDFLWPMPVPPCEPIKVAQRKRLGMENKLRVQHQIRLKLYSIWLLATLGPAYSEENWEWIDQFAADVSNDLPQLAKRIKAGLVATRKKDLGDGPSKYRNWYTINLDRIPSLPGPKVSEELGSAMIFSSHQIPAICLILMQARVEWIYLLMRSFEESVLLEETSLAQGKIVGQAAQADETAHEASAQLSAAFKLLDYIKREKTDEVTNYVKGSVAYALLFLHPKPELIAIDDCLLKQDQRAEDWLRSCISMAWRICVSREARAVNREADVFGQHGLVDVNRIPLNCDYRVTPVALRFEPSPGLESHHKRLRWDLSRWVLASLSNAIKWSGTKGDGETGIHLLKKWSVDFEAQNSSPFKSSLIALNATERYTELVVCNGFYKRYGDTHSKDDGTPMVLNSIETRLPLLEERRFGPMKHYELNEYLPSESHGFISRIRLGVKLFQPTLA
jgi:hypothetical protein